jgi:hypothetical protein
MPRDIVIQHTIDEKTKKKWDRQRWKEHGVSELPQGFTIKKDGRAGSIYFRRGERILELYYEISGDPAYDILLWQHSLSNWILPGPEPVPPEEQQAIRAELEQWLQANETRAHFTDEGSAGGPST